MHARHLVRCLLELRRSGSEPIQFGLNIGNGDRGQAQTANDAQFRRGFPGHVGLLGQSGFPQQKIELGQQCNLSSQSLNTVSGFWVPFKRRAA